MKKAVAVRGFALVAGMAVVLLLGCPARRAEHPRSGPAAKVAALEGVDLGLLEAPGAELPAPPGASAGRALTATEVEAVLARVPALGAAPATQVELALRERRAAPPRAGATTTIGFPTEPAAGGAAPAGVSAPLTVLRYAPEGDLEEMAPSISVTFSQPMLELSTATPPEPPITITPPVVGAWRWVGTQTALFEPRGRTPAGSTQPPPLTRFAGSTSYTVEIPAGTRSAVGGTLAAATRFSFMTAPLELRDSSPWGTVDKLRPIMVTSFDQAIDPAAVLATISVAGRKGDALELVPRAELDRDEELKSRIKAIEDGTGTAPGPRWLAFRTRDELPRGIEAAVVIGPGTPSAEGPRKTTERLQFGFATYGDLKVDDASCSWSSGQRKCDPRSRLYVRFSNDLDARRFQQRQVTVTPTPRDLEIALDGRQLTITGKLRQRSTYTVALAGNLVDVHGQTLGKPQRFSFEMLERAGTLSGLRRYLTLDPRGKPTVLVQARNLPQLRLRVWAITPTLANLADFEGWARVQDSRDEPAPRQWAKLLETTVKPPLSLDEDLEVALDLSPALPKGLGHRIVLVDVPQPPGSKERRQASASWVQATRLGVDAFHDRRDAVVLTTRLADGAPEAGVTITTVPNGVTLTSGTDGLTRFALTPLVPLPPPPPPDPSAPRPTPSPSDPDAPDEIEMDMEIEMEPEPGDFADGDDGPIIQYDTEHAPQLLLAQKGDDVAMVTGTAWSFETDREPSLEWLVWDDRHTYRPGETVHLKGYVRGLQNTRGGDTTDLGTIGVRSSSVSYFVTDDDGAEIAAGKAKLGVLGSFDTQFTLPRDVRLGEAGIHLGLDPPPRGVLARHARHRFSIQEFRRPEFEVVVSPEPEVVHVGDTLKLRATASYFSGGGLGGAEVDWNVAQEPVSYTPPGRDDFVFGRFVPWWTREYAYRDYSNRQRRRRGLNGIRYSGETDASGNHVQAVQISRPKTGSLPVRVTAEASVMDVNRQSQTGSTSTLVHSGELYVGLRSERMFTDPGTPIAVEALVTDLDGRAVPGRAVNVNASRTEWVVEAGTWTERELERQDCNLTSTSEPLPCRFTAKVGGMYYVRATVKDSAGRESFTELTRWVSGGSALPQRDLGKEAVTLIPDRKSYRAGDVARVLVQSPFFPAEGVMVLARSGLLEARRFRMTGPTHTLEIPIVEGHVPNLWLEVELVGSAVAIDDRGRPLPRQARRPAYAGGELELAVPPLARTLQVTATPKQAQLAPGEHTEVALEVRDATGKPVAGAELAVVVVDDAVLALSGEAPEDPLLVFYPRRRAEVDLEQTRASVVLRRPGDDGPAPPRELWLDDDSLIRPEGEAVDARSFSSSNSRTPKAVTVRSDFEPLAAWAPSVMTGADGRARVDVKLPGNLTRYRVRAMAVAGGRQFGVGESALTARLPLMVRPALPRFLNFGDRFQLAVVVQNQTSAAMTVDVVVRADNAQLLGAGATSGARGSSAGRQVVVPARDRVELQFPAAAVQAGKARFQIVGVGSGAGLGDPSDAAELSIPVWTPATSDAVATYGVIDQSGGAISLPVRAPGAVFKQFGGVDITTGSTELQALTDAVLYLTSYPYECAEQVSSRVLAVAALGDVLAGLKASGLPPQADIEAAMRRDLLRLGTMQNSDGGWGFWSNNRSWPLVSIHVTHALARASARKFKVDPQLLESARDHLRHLEKQLTEDDGYGPAQRRPLVAYALYVRALLGDRDLGRARKLLAEVKLADHELETLGWLWPVLASDAKSAGPLAALRRHVANRVVEEAGTAHWVTHLDDAEQLLLGSDRRVDGILLSALVADRAADPALADLIPKVVRGLMAHRTAGHWGSTQDNAWVLLALQAYFHAFEATEPAFTAETWFGELQADPQRFAGRSATQQRLEIPMAFVARSPAAQTLVLQKRGSGRLYYRVGMRSASTDLAPPAAEHGFTVLRGYEAVDQPDDVRRDDHGVWHVRAGATVRVRVTMVAPTRRYHVALTDPLPAGLEAQNSALASTGSLPDDADDSPYWWWSRSWYEHQELHDERAEAFTTQLWDGVHEYVYYARATTLGSFVVPPAKAEEMYAPETYGRSAGDRMVIE